MNSKMKHPCSWPGRVGQYADQMLTEKFLMCFREINKTHDINAIDLLDIGCGNGGFTREFSNNTGNPSGVNGCDISETSIEQCKKLNPAISYFVQDALEPLPEDKMYDVMVFTTVLAQFTRDVQMVVLSNACKQLNKDGYLIVCDVNSERTTAIFEHFVTSSFYDVLINENFSRRFLKKYPGMMLADRIPFALLEILEKIVPGDDLLKILLLRNWN